jgi:hypothetical protein
MFWHLSPARRQLKSCLVAVVVLRHPVHCTLRITARSFGLALDHLGMVAEVLKAFKRAAGRA